MKLFITGVNGFIGTHLLEAILRDTDWTVSGLDLQDDNLAPFRPFVETGRFAFQRGDIFTDMEAIEQEVRAADVVLPLAGIAKPAYYIKKPIWTFELDFEQNLKIVRLCAEYDKRVVFPSTSEVYGMSGDEAIHEDESQLITGPIAKTRWIYSCSKQMMDRMIFAYGQERGLRFSIFRPFNWLGPRLDTFEDARSRTARSITQMVYDILTRGTVTLVDGGTRRRSFTWVGDGIEGILAILRNEGGRADGQIFNIGNPANNYTIRELAGMIVEEMQGIPQFADRAGKVVWEIVPAAEYYGKTYEDMQNRVPSIEKMTALLGWQPRTSMRDTLRMTLAWHAEHATI